MGLSSNRTCRECGTEVQASVHVLCKCEVLVSFRHAYLGFFSFDPEDVMNLSRSVVSELCPDAESIVDIVPWWRRSSNSG